VRDGGPALLQTFAWYSENPERISFLHTPKDGKMTIEIAEPR